VGASPIIARDTQPARSHSDRQLLTAPTARREARPSEHGLCLAGPCLTCPTAAFLSCTLYPVGPCWCSPRDVPHHVISTAVMQASTAGVLAGHQYVLCTLPPHTRHLQEACAPKGQDG
jgi:hypothetical protein